MEQSKAKADFKDSKFLKFIYAYLLKMRQKIWLQEGAESEGQFSISQELIAVIKSLANSANPY